MANMSNTQRQQSDLLTPILVRMLSGRSGSTLLMQLLGTSNEIVFDRVYPFEVRYLTYLVRWAMALKEQVPPTDEWNFGTRFTEPGGFVGPFPSLEAHYWDGDAMWKQALVSTWERFSQVVFEKHGGDAHPKYYAEKSAPWLSTYLKDIIPYRVVLLVRDPRDTFLSITAFNKKRGVPDFSRRKWEGDMAFAKRWVGLMRKRAEVAKKEQETTNSMLVRYEDLVSDLAGQAQRLGDWLDVELNAQQVESQVGDFAHHMTSESPILSVGRWRREMSPRLSAFITKELHDELTCFGYDV